MMATSRDNVTKLHFHRVVIEDTDWWRHIEYSETTNDTWGQSFGCQRRSCDGLVSTRRYTHLFHMFEQVSSSEYQRNVATRSVQPWRNRLDMPSRTKAFQLTNAHLWTLYSAELQFLSTDDKCGTIRCNARLCHSTSVEIWHNRKKKRQRIDPIFRLCWVFLLAEQDLHNSDSRGITFRRHPSWPSRSLPKSRIEAIADACNWYRGWKMLRLLRWYPFFHHTEQLSLCSSRRWYRLKKWREGVRFRFRMIFFLARFFAKKHLHRRRPWAAHIYNQY